MGTISFNSYILNKIDIFKQHAHIKPKYLKLQHGVKAMITIFELKSGTTYLLTIQAQHFHGM